MRGKFKMVSWRFVCPSTIHTEVYVYHDIKSLIQFDFEFCRTITNNTLTCWSLSFQSSLFHLRSIFCFVLFLTISTSGTAHNHNSLPKSSFQRCHDPEIWNTTPQLCTYYKSRELGSHRILRRYNLLYKFLSTSTKHWYR